MDVTPPKTMLEAMQKITDSWAGEAPHPTDHSRTAGKRRQQRRLSMDVLHDLVRHAMRTGVARYLQSMGKPTVPDSIIPQKRIQSQAISDVLDMESGAPLDMDPRRFNG